MQVYDISVRFMRRIQVREYEPAEAEVIIKAQIAEGEKVEAAIDEAYKTASAHVHTALGLPADTKLPKRNKPAGEVTASATVAPAAGAKPADAPKPQPQQAAKSDIPGDDIPATAGAAAPATQVNSDIPDTASSAAPAQSSQPAAFEQLTAAELSKWIGEQVRLGKVTSAAIMSLYPKFGVSRFADLKPEKCGEAKAEIQKIIDGTGAL